MAHAQFERVEKRLITKPFIFFALIFLASLYFLFIRFTKGIGAASNMSDGYPWGIWIAYDVVVGTGLACGGYALAILIYLLRRKEFYPLIRGAVLTSALGYTMAGASVIIDLGRYWNAYHFLLPNYWNLNSVLLEVGLCVMAYTLVLWVELSEPIAEWLAQRSSWDKERLKKIAEIVTVVSIAGMLLPTMHQSSLGSIQLISMAKLHPLWHSAFLPLLYLVSCVLMGYAVVTCESLLSSLFFGRKYETHILSGLTYYMVFIALGWSILRIIDIVFTHKAFYLFSSGKMSLLFWTEMLLFVVPSLFLLKKRYSESPRWLFVFSLLYLAGGALYRFSSYLIAWSPGKDWVYFPSFAEAMITFGIISLEVLIYLIFVKTFPILPKEA
ncbi:MAG: Ni/Fe-hydrogenase cytochrome b subunit [Deferribacteres bacterium]|nr:Ni/Fe-hydrogenase cytochrome b subunit [Deferribacteres bacterium]